MEDLTTIQVLKSDAERIQKLKVHERQPDREIVHMLLEKFGEVKE